MAERKDIVPNPGSDEAVKQGCQCPRMDNAYGKGWLGGVKNEHGNTLFVISGNCELHRKWDESDAR